MKKEGGYDWFFREYERHLEGQTGMLDTLSRIEGRIALLCYERNPDECHRGSVARRLAERTSLQVQHLKVRAGFAAIQEQPCLDIQSRNIRPLAVRPLTHPERVPNPWGFSLNHRKAKRRCRIHRQVHQICSTGTQSKPLKHLLATVFRLPFPEARYSVAD